MPNESLPTPTLQADRLLLRAWHDDDLPAFAALNADERVMEHFSNTLSRAESDEFVARIRKHFAGHGFGHWAVELPGVAPFIGFVGLAIPRFEAHFMPAVEIGWRLARAHWNKGYATEAARAAVSYGFDTLGLAEIVSLTAVENLPSRRVMEKIGMTHDPAGDFDHPSLPSGHRLERHVLYRLGASTTKPRLA